MVSYRILGPIEAEHGGRPLPLAGQAVEVLAVLLVHANQIVSTDTLIDALWGDRRDDKAKKRLQMAIKRLREALGPAADDLHTARAGYSLALTPEQCDASVFEQRLATGQSALAAGSADAAAQALRAALGLWRGPALNEVAYRSFAQLEIARLDQLRLTAYESCFAAELELGRERELIGELGRLQREHPTREVFAGQLMLALYRSGRQSDALSLYQATRVQLNEELGLDPGPALARLQEQILAKDVALLPSSPPPAPRPAGGLGLPPPPRIVAPTPLIGRDREHQRIGAAVAHATDGARRVILIGGEPGVGKTRLAHEAARTAHEHGFATLWGASVEGVGAPYGLWISALAAVAEDPAVERHAAVLWRLMPQLEPVGDVPGQTDPEVQRYLLFRAVVALLEALCARQPIALTFDDLQWADGPSLELLRYVAHSSAHLRLLILGTYREAPRPTRELAALDGVERIELHGLDTADVAALMQQLNGLDPRIAAEITHETGGNPFFVGQLLRHLTESDALEDDGNGRRRLRRPLAELELPPSVNDVVQQRVARLGPDAEALLRIAAVIGRTFDLDLLRRVARVDEETALAVLQRGREGAILVESDTGRFSFAHAIVNHSLYDFAGRTVTAIVHRRVAQALETADDADDRLAELAHHWARAGGKDDVARAVHFAGRAGERALTQLAPQEAVTRFEQGLALLGERDAPAQRCDLLIGLGEAQRRLGVAAFRERLLEASALAERLDDHERMTRAVLANTLGAFGAAGPPDRERILTIAHALDRVPPEWPHRALMTAILARERYFGGDPLDGAALADEALALARGLDDRREFARVLALSSAVSAVTPLDVHGPLVRELVEAADALEDPELRFRAAHARFIFSMHSGSRAELDAGVTTMRRLADEIHQPILVWTAIWAEAARTTIDGDLETAEAELTHAAAIARQHGLTRGRLIAFGQLMSLRTEQDRLHELAPAVREQIAAAPAMRLLRLSRAFIDAETGDLPKAAEFLEREAADGFPFDFDRTRAFNLARCADIALRLAHEPIATQLYAVLLPDREQFATTGGVSTRGSIELNLGRLATLLRRFDDADAHLRKAESAHERLGAPLLLARTHLARAEWALAAAREPRTAAEHLERSRTLARRHGGIAVQREAEALSRRMGAGTRASVV